MTATAIQSLRLLERVYAREAIEPPEPDKRVMLWAGTSLSIAGVPLLVGEGEIDEITIGCHDFNVFDVWSSTKKTASE